MSLLMWAAHNVYGIEHPLAYMDNAFGIDLAGSMRWQRCGPDKAPHGRRITITGINSDLDSFSVSLPHKAIEDLVKEIDAFLLESSRHPTLRKWRQMTGWLSWSLNVAPQACPYLTPLYEKLASKKFSDAGVPINTLVATALTAMATLLVESPSLRGTGAGLGFWFEWKATVHHYYCRPQQTYKCIQFAKNLTVVLALGIVTHPSSPFKPLSRVLVCTDSAPAVYAVDSGAAKDSDFMPLRTLTLRSYVMAQHRKFDLKVIHVHGKDNTLTDDLSRQHEDRRLVSFAPRPLLEPATRAQPMLPLDDLCQLRNEAAILALEPKTQSDYTRAVRQWIAFISYYRAQGHDIMYHPTEDMLSAFIQHRFRTVSSVYQTLSGLAFHFLPVMGNTWTTVRSSQLVRNTIIGGIKLKRRARKQAKPLGFRSVALVLRTAGALRDLDYDSLLFLAMVSLGFASCARSAELTVPSTIRFWDPAKLPQRSTVKMDSNGFSVHLPYHKADRRWQGSFLYFTPCTTDPAFLRILHRYLQARDSRNKSCDLLFLTRGGLPPTRTWFIGRLRRTFGSAYSGHSLRAGGATHYALQGLLADIIKRLGCWRSSAWEQYVRVSLQLQQALLNSA
ncbi:BQ5605_C006g04101 [Microbotryum silenes-dioicae]|uniref:BQ5605_C006g04101 protein n=1 Tax=Microbotryum silenes-dioicae TaxID=796604 RepID=A0A2X0P8D5_9BASI|nr:BQ5605_C006g04101 [Microbotryum silenes-dioicae]